MGLDYSTGIQYEAYGDIRPMLELAKIKNINLISMYWDGKVSRIVVPNNTSFPTPTEYMKNGILMESNTVYIIPFDAKPGSFLSNINKLSSLGYLNKIDTIYLGENNVMILVPKKING